MLIQFEVIKNLTIKNDIDVLILYNNAYDNVNLDIGVIDKLIIIFDVYCYEPELNKFIERVKNNGKILFFNTIIYDIDCSRFSSVRFTSCIILNIIKGDNNVYMDHDTILNDRIIDIKKNIYSNSNSKCTLISNNVVYKNYDGRTKKRLRIICHNLQIGKYNYNGEVIIMNTYKLYGYGTITYNGDDNDTKEKEVKVKVKVKSDKVVNDDDKFLDKINYPFLSDMVRYEGYFKNNKPHKYGIIYKKDGQIIDHMLRKGSPLYVDL